MAQLVGVLQTSHGPLNKLADRWEGLRHQNRPRRSDTPFETESEQVEKAERSVMALSILNNLLYDLNPDVIVMFGDDQCENFDFNNYPMISVFAGQEFNGPDSTSRNRPEAFHNVKGHPALGTAILMGLLHRGFDPGFMLGDSNPARGMCHAIMWPLEFFDAYHIPIVPILINNYFAPEATAMRCYQVGKAVREVIDSFPDDLRVVIMGSGGMWHTPGQPDSYLDEVFDNKLLEYLAKGDPKGMAEYFDAYQVPEGDLSQESIDTQGMTGLPSVGGPRLGTRETCELIAAAGAVEGKVFTIIDYIPINAIPLGAAFAYCLDI
jgi:hypothetical protein